MKIHSFNFSGARGGRRFILRLLPALAALMLAAGCLQSVLRGDDEDDGFHSFALGYTAQLVLCNSSVIVPRSGSVAGGLFLGDQEFFVWSGEGERGLLQTTDAGETFQSLALPVSDWGEQYRSGRNLDLEVVPSGVLYSAFGGRTYRSADGGLSWANIDTDQPDSTPGRDRPAWHGILFGSEMRGFRYSGGYGPLEIESTFDGGDSWAYVSHGYGIAPFRRPSSGRMLFSQAVTTASYVQLYESFDEGQSLVPLSTISDPAKDGLQAGSFIDDSNGLVYVAGRLYKTTDGGAAWTEIVNSLTGRDSIGLRMLDATTGYAVVNNSSGMTFWKTTDGGATFNLLMAAAEIDSPSVWGIFPGGVHRLLQDNTLLLSSDDLATVSSVSLDLSGLRTTNQVSDEWFCQVPGAVIGEILTQ